MKYPAITSSLVIMLVAISNSAAAASVSDALAERGHPNTTMCSSEANRLGLGQLSFIQFERHGDYNEDREEANAILKLLAQALVDAGVRNFGFEAAKDWTNCRARDPEFIYWRDYNDNWRYMTDKPRQYLSQLLKELPAEQMGTTEQAYILWSLGVVEQRLGRQKASLEKFEQAHEILQDSADPNGILAYLLLPLIHYNLGDDGDAQRGQVLLEEFALVSEASAAGGNYLPLIKVAPQYPTVAFQTGIEGYVLLEFTVDAEGRVLDPMVVEESPEDVFGAAAVQAAREFRYVPKVVNGKRVTTTGVRNRIMFEIE